MKSLKAFLLPVVLCFTLASCGGGTSTPPPAEPPPTGPPTTPIDPPTTPPTVPPISPEPPVTPEPPSSVPFGGGWIWVVVFEDESTAAGVLAITQLESEPVLLSESGEGPYIQCSETTCPEEPDGLGIMGTFIDEEAATESFTSLFIDPDLDTFRLIAFDADGLLGTEIEGEDTFLGGGQWTNDDGSTVNVAVGISRIPEEGTSEGLQRELARVLKARQDTLGNVDVLKGKKLR